MRVEDNVYILTSEIRGETMYLIDAYDGYDYSFDIRNALKAANKVTASLIKDAYEDELGGAKSDLRIVPLKITYEW